MTGIISSRSPLGVDSIAKPNPRLVASDRGNHLQTIIRASDESPKTAVIAFLTAGSSGNSELLRKARGAAREDDGKFYALMVDLRRTLFVKAQVRTLIDDAILASHLGAKVVWIESSDVVDALLEFARQSHVGRIFVLRSRPVPFYRPFGRTVYSDLLRRGDGFRIDVVGFERES